MEKATVDRWDGASETFRDDRANGLRSFAFWRIARRETRLEMPEHRDSTVPDNVRREAHTAETAALH